MMFPRARQLTVALIAAALATVMSVACSLNPQPIPPLPGDNDERGNDANGADEAAGAASSSGSGGTPVNDADAGGRSDAGDGGNIDAGTCDGATSCGDAGH